MRARVLVAAAALACALAAGAVSAQTVYRCGPEGRSYSQTPCPDGAGRVLDVSDPRGDTQRAQAERVAQRERALARRMVKQRRAREAALQPALAVAVGPRASAARSGRPHRRAKKKPSKHKHAQPAARQDFTIILPAPRR